MNKVQFRIFFMSLFILAIIVLAGCTNAEERCAQAEMEVGFYETCAARAACNLTEDERRFLIHAKRDVITWCSDEN